MPINKQIDKPKSIKINGERYYIVNELKKYDPVYFFGYTKMTRKIIDKKGMSDDDYLYATFNSATNKWTTYKDNIPPKALLYFKKTWVQTHIPTMKQENTNNKSSSKSNDTSNKDDGDNTHSKKKNTSDANEESNTNDYQKAPPLLILNDEENFKDDKGNIVEIETRDERKKPIVQKYIFLTYEGMMKVLYSSRSSKAKAFRTWATQTLFTVQMGTTEQKENLASGILGVPIGSLKQVLSASTSSVPCVYRFTFGKCKDLRKAMNIPQNIPDDYTIIKYGYTDDLARRTNEHAKTFGTIKGVTLELLNYTYIDPKYLSQAEVDIKDFFVAIEIPIKYEKFDELVAIDPKHEKQILVHFKHIAIQYSGCVKELTDKIENLQHTYQMKLLKEQHKNEKYVMEIEKLNIIIDKKNSDLENKRLELENKDLKMELSKRR